MRSYIWPIVNKAEDSKEKLFETSWRRLHSTKNNSNEGKLIIMSEWQIFRAQWNIQNLISSLLNVMPMEFQCLCSPVLQRMEKVKVSQSSEWNHVPFLKCGSFRLLLGNLPLDHQVAAEEIKFIQTINTCRLSVGGFGLLIFGKLPWCCWQNSLWIVQWLTWKTRTGGNSKQLAVRSCFSVVRLFYLFRLNKLASIFSRITVYQCGLIISSHLLNKSSQRSTLTWTWLEY